MIKMMNRTKAAQVIEKELCKVTAPGMGAEFLEALQTAEVSLRLWDSFIEKLAEKCNESMSAAEWMTFRKAIEIIKAEFDEKIG
jgi:hypothetical protein